MFNLISATAVETGASGSAVHLPYAGLARAGKFVLSITADESTASDKLNVWIQHSPDGTYWQDLARFAEQSGNAGATTIVGTLNWVSETNETEAQTTSDGSLGASAVVNGPMWPYLRVKYTITDDSTNAAFTFTVKAHLLYR